MAFSSDVIDREAVPAGSRYNATAQALHWLTAVLMFAVLPLAWVMVSLGPEAPSRGLLFTLHKSTGLTILALAAIRLLWRARYHAPELRDVSATERALAFASHWLLYLVLILMPVSGYVLSAAGGHPVTYFGLFTLPGLPQNDAVAKAADWLHVGVGQWAVYLLIALHVLATVWHVTARRDGVLDRMLPRQDRVRPRP